MFKISFCKLKIYKNGPNGQFIKRICGFGDPDPIFSNTSVLYFKSKKAPSLYAYSEFYYIATNTQDGGCGGELEDFYGIFSNPNYKQNLRINQECRWTLRVPIQFNVSLYFHEFDMGTLVTCDTNFVELIEVNEGVIERVVKRYCGQTKPKSYVAMRNILVVRFKKNVHFAGTGFLAGFSSTQDGWFFFSLFKCLIN